MRRLFYLLFCLLFFSACATHVPVEPGVIPKPPPITVAEEQYGHEMLGQLTEKWELDYSDPRYNKIQDIVDRLAKPIGADKDPWHVYLLKAPEVKNAAATRGNHIFVWSGILDFTENEDEIATILSHEMAHILARHTDPNPQQVVSTVLIQTVAIAAGTAVAIATNDPNVGQIAGDLTATMAAELGKGALLNPYTKELEIEADQIGLMIMAKAKYDPKKAVIFWERMAKVTSSSTIADFFSSHPLGPERIANLKNNLNLAISYYNGIDPVVRKKAYSKINSWVISSSVSPVHEKPQNDAAVFESLKKGDVVTAVEVEGGWLKVSDPVEGYIERVTAVAR